MLRFEGHSLHARKYRCLPLLQFDIAATISAQLPNFHAGNQIASQLPLMQQGCNQLGVFHITFAPWHLFD